MSTLPAALRPWAAELSLFPEDVAGALGAHVARLAPALAPLPREAPGAAGEPDGYEGLARRGSPERLLVSEWALALEHPEEFLRRAAVGEQAHLRPAFRRPVGARRSLALFDAGPSQLGTPRLAHLALLVLLARRAQAAGAAFSWCVLQQPPGSLREGLTPEGVKALLEARCAQEVRDAHLAAWREWLGLADVRALGAEDVWLVGGTRLMRLSGASAAGRVEVAEAEEGRALEVAVHPPRAGARRVALELPREALCVRLLRDPFEVARPPPQRLAAAGMTAFCFGAGGKQLVCRERDGGVVAIPIPGSPRDSSRGRRRRLRLPQGHTLVGLGWRHPGGLVVATWNQEQLTLDGAFPSLGGKHGPIHFPAPADPMGEDAFRPPLTPEPLLWMRQQSKRRELFALRDARGVAFVLTLEAGKPPSLERWGLFRALVQVADRWVGVEPPPADPQTALVVRLGPEAMYAYGIPPGTGDREAVFGDVSCGAHTQVRALMAVRREQDPELWRVYASEDASDLLTPEGARVVGVATRDGTGTSPLGLLVLGKDGRTLSLAGRGAGRHPLLTAPDDIVQVRTCTEAPLVAYATRSGAVTVYSLRFGAPVLELHAEEGA